MADRAMGWAAVRGTRKAGVIWHGVLCSPIGLMCVSEHREEEDWAHS